MQKRWSIKVQGWTPLKILIFLHWSWDLLKQRFSENAVLFHLEWLCWKTTGNVNQPPYHYIAAIHWACPASSANFQTKLEALFTPDNPGRFTIPQFFGTDIQCEITRRFHGAYKVVLEPKFENTVILSGVQGCTTKDFEFSYFHTQYF